VQSSHAQSTGGAPAEAVRHGGREVVAVFAGLLVLTALELGVIRAPGVARAAVVAALVGLAVAKAALIALFFMHLRYETRILKFTVLGPLAAPAVYALVLMADAAWRLLR